MVVLIYKHYHYNGIFLTLKLKNKVDNWRDGKGSSENHLMLAKA